jgi:hypothetical protein
MQPSFPHSLQDELNFHPKVFVAHSGVVFLKHTMPTNTTIDTFDRCIALPAMSSALFGSTVPSTDVRIEEATSLVVGQPKAVSLSVDVITLPVLLW